MSPADLTAILTLHDDGVLPLEISAQTCVPVKEVRQAIATHRPPAAARDQRVDAVIKLLLDSSRQRVRNLGARLDAVYAEAIEVFNAENARRVERERLKQERQRQRERVEQLKAALAEARAELRAKAAKRGNAA